jgi:hypothetical protein
MFITLDANQARAEQDRSELGSLLGKQPVERADNRKEIASGDGDFTRVSLSEGKFIDLAIHRDTFLDDCAIRTDVTAEEPLAWKSKYDPTIGVTTGSTLGGGLSTSYAVQDQHAFLNPFVVDAISPKVPNMLLTQNVQQLGIRDRALLRQAEALRIKEETFLANIMMDAPLGTDLATTVTNYWNNKNAYDGKTIYVTDPGVQNGTVETSNVLDLSAEAGLTPAVFEQLMIQEQKTGLTIRTIHIPKAGFAFRKLLRACTIVTTTALTAGHSGNANLEGLPAEEFLKMWRTNMNDALDQGLIIEIFGRRYKIKANNALPEGYCIVTTNEPAAEIFNITDRSVSVDINDPKEPYWSEHYEKRMIAIGAPHPWRRNFFLAYIGATVLQ